MSPNCHKAGVGVVDFPARAKRRSPRSARRTISYREVLRPWPCMLRWQHSTKCCCRGEAMWNVASLWKRFSIVAGVVTAAVAGGAIFFQNIQYIIDSNIEIRDISVSRPTSYNEGYRSILLTGDFIKKGITPLYGCLFELKFENRPTLIFSSEREDINTKSWIGLFNRQGRIFKFIRGSANLIGINTKNREPTPVDVRMRCGSVASPWVRTQIPADPSLN